MSVHEGDGGSPIDKEHTAHNRQYQSKTGKKPYQAPAFRFERVFETMALACGKINPTQSHCRLNRKSS